MDNTNRRDGLALVFASFFPLAMTYGYFVVLDDPEMQNNQTLVTAFGIGKFVQFLFPAAYVAWFERDRIRFPKPTARGLLFAAGFGLIVAAAIFVLYFAWLRYIPAVAHDTPIRIFEKVKQFGLDTPMKFLGMAVAISVVHSALEEYYWRWFVFGWMRRHMRSALAILLSSLGFMLHHVVILEVYFPGHFWTMALPFALCVAVGGGVWAWLYERSDSLVAPWLSHCLIDAAILGVGYVMLEQYW